MTTRPDVRLLATARIIENLAAKIVLARINARTQINAIGQLHATTYDDDGRGGDRTILVDVECPGTWLGHPCRIDGLHTHKEAVPVTAVEDYALRRTQLENHLADLEAHCKAITTIAANASRDADRLIGTHTPGLPIPRCNAEGRDGSKLPWPGIGLPHETRGWADPTCTDIPTRGPLCDRCSKREYRWRLERGLTIRRDGVYAGDLNERTG